MPRTSLRLPLPSVCPPRPPLALARSACNRSDEASQIDELDAELRRGPCGQSGPPPITPTAMSEGGPSALPAADTPTAALARPAPPQLSAAGRRRCADPSPTCHRAAPTTGTPRERNPNSLLDSISAPARLRSTRSTHCHPAALAQGLLRLLLPVPEDGVK